MNRLLWSAVLLAGPALAQSAQGDVAVTIYNDNLALVQDVRQLSIPAGRSRLEFPDVSGQIRAETVSFEAPDTGIVEQNFDYDLLSPAKLMEKAVGKVVTIVRLTSMPMSAAALWSSDTARMAVPVFERITNR